MAKERQEMYPLYQHGCQQVPKFLEKDEEQRKPYTIFLKEREEDDISQMNIITKYNTNLNYLISAFK